MNKNTLALFCFNPAILPYNFISFKSHADVFNDNVQACNLNHFMSVTFFFFQYDDISLNNCILLSDHGPFKTTVKNSFVYLHYSISFFKIFFFCSFLFWYHSFWFLFYIIFYCIWAIMISNFGKRFVHFSSKEIFMMIFYLLQSGLVTFKSIKIFLEVTFLLSFFIIKNHRFLS